jgi:predicted permease
MVDLPTVIVRGVHTTLTYLCTLCVGGLLSAYPSHAPLLGPQFCKQLGALTVAVFMPALMAVSFGEGLSVDLLVDGGAWVLLLFAMIQLVANTIVGLGIRAAVRPPEAFSTEFLLAMVSTNGVSLPLIMLEPLCRQSPLKDSSFGKEGDITAYQLATTYIFIYNIPMSFYLFGVAFSYLYTPDPGRIGGANKPKSKGHELIERAFLNKPMISLYVGAFVGLVAPVKELFFGKEAPLLFVTSTVRTLGAPMVGVLSLLVGEELVHHTLSITHSALFTQHRTLCTLHSASYTLHSSLSTIQAALCTQHRTLCTLHSASYALHSYTVPLRPTMHHR